MGKRSSRAKRLDKRTAETQTSGLLKLKPAKPLKAAKTKAKKPAKALCSATDSEDILHEMLAAAATGGGRFWKKKQRQLDKREGQRRASATALRAASITMERRAGLSVSGNDLEGEPFERCFWKGRDDGGDPSPQLKHLRKGLGIRVHPGPPGCPAPVAPTLTQEPLLPDVFSAYFSQTKLGNTPTTVQRQAWPVLLSGRDCLCVSPTGSGKTLAYLLPLVPHVLAQPRPQVGDGPLALVLVPTRELAQQVKRSAAPLRALFGVRVASVSGGLLRHEREAQVCDLLENTNHIVVGTPGRLADLATAVTTGGGGGGGGGDGEGGEEGGVEGATASEQQVLKLPVLPLRRVSFLVLDECDRMLAQGFESQLKAIASQVRSDRVTACFSATFPSALRAAADDLLRNQPVILRVAAADVNANTSDDSGGGGGGSTAAAAAAAKLESRGNLAATQNGTTGDDGDDHKGNPGGGGGAGGGGGGVGVGAVAMSSTITHEVAVVASAQEKALVLVRHLESILLSTAAAARSETKKRKTTDERDGKRGGGKSNKSVRVLVFCNRVATVDALVAYLRGEHDRTIISPSLGANGLGNDGDDDDDDDDSDNDAADNEEDNAAGDFGALPPSKAALASAAAAAATVEAAAAAEAYRKAVKVADEIKREKARRKSSKFQKIMDSRTGGGSDDGDGDGGESDGDDGKVDAAVEAEEADAKEDARRKKRDMFVAEALAKHLCKDAKVAEHRQDILLRKKNKNKRQRFGGSEGETGGLIAGSGAGVVEKWGGLRVGALHGQLGQLQREEALADFSRGKLQVLVATDLAGRGLHVSGLDFVVNFDLPAEGRVSEQYPHRVGRTGRAGMPGNALTILAVPGGAGGAGGAGSGGGGAVSISLVAAPLNSKSNPSERRQHKAMLALSEDGQGAVRELEQLFKAAAVTCEPLELLVAKLDEEAENEELIQRDGNEANISSDTKEGNTKKEQGDNEDNDDNDEDDGEDSGDDERQAVKAISGGKKTQKQQQQRQQFPNQTSKWTRADFVAELWEFYEEHCPSKLGEVQVLADKYFEVPGPATFLEALRLKYDTTGAEAAGGKRAEK